MLHVVMCTRERTRVHTHTPKTKTSRQRSQHGEALSLPLGLPGYRSATLGSWLSPRTFSTSRPLCQGLPFPDQNFLLVWGLALCQEGGRKGGGGKKKREKSSKWCFFFFFFGNREGYALEQEKLVGWWVLPLVGPSVSFCDGGASLLQKIPGCKMIIVTMVSGQTTETVSGSAVS